MGAPGEVAGRRVVLDTNVVLSALVFSQGSLAWVREAWQNGLLLPLASRDTVAELLRSLAYPKFKLLPEDQEDLLAEYLPWCETVMVPRSIRVPRCRDPHDEAFLRLARTAKADFLVTGDDDLVALSSNFEVQIVRPAQLRDQLDPK